MSKTIMLGIPTLGTIETELAMRLIQWSHMYKMKIFPTVNLVPVDNARNTIVAEFLRGDDDYLLFVDDDIIPPLNAIEELIKMDVDIACPLCFCMKKDDNGFMVPMPVAFRYVGDKCLPYYGQGSKEVDVGTGGMILIKRKVLEKMERPFYFTYNADGTLGHSEDFIFFMNAQKRGFKTFVNYDLICGHKKVCDIKDINNLLAGMSHGR